MLQCECTSYGRSGANFCDHVPCYLECFRTCESSVKVGADIGKNLRAQLIFNVLIRIILNDRQEV